MRRPDRTVRLGGKAIRAPATSAGKLVPAVAALLLLIGLSTVAFHLAFGGPWAIAFYRTVVTISTLGDSRLLPATSLQYAVLGATALLGYAVWGLFVAVLAGTLISIDIRARWGGPSVMDRIARLRSHTVVIGGGRVGQQVATELARLGEDVVVVERSPERAQHLTEAGLLVLLRDALEEGVLAMAGVGRAAGVVLALPDDAQNLYVLLAVRDIAPDVRVVARAEGARAERHLNALGVGRVVLPTTLAGKRMARLISRPYASDFFAAVLDEAGLEVREVLVQPGSDMDGRAVREVRLHLDQSATLLAIHRNGEFLALPSADTLVRPGDVLILACVLAGEAARGDERPASG